MSVDQVWSYSPHRATLKTVPVFLSGSFHFWNTTSKFSSFILCKFDEEQRAVAIQRLTRKCVFRLYKMSIGSVINFYFVAHFLFASKGSSLVIFVVKIIHKSSARWFPNGCIQSRRDAHRRPAGCFNFHWVLVILFWQTQRVVRVNVLLGQPGEYKRGANLPLNAYFLEEGGSLICIRLSSTTNSSDPSVKNIPHGNQTRTIFFFNMWCGV